MTPLSSREQFSAGALALLFHVVLFMALVFSVSWRQTPNLPAQAELWSSLPAPRPVPPVKVVPKPAPKPEPAPEPPKADIALQPKKKPEPPKPEPKPEPKPKPEPVKAKPEPKPEPKKVEPDKKQLEREAQRKALEKALAEQADSELAQEAAQLNRMRQQQQASAARDKLIDDYRAKIIQKVRGYLRLPPNLTGNPEAIFRVDLLPNGEVIGTPVLVKSSGNALYDREVERAIIKASPLPLPPDREAAAVFRSGLTLKFRPKEG